MTVSTSFLPFSSSLSLFSTSTTTVSLFLFLPSFPLFHYQRFSPALVLSGKSLFKTAHPVRVVVMSHDNADRQSESVADAVTAMKLEHDGDGSPPVTNGSGAAKREEIDELPPNGANPTITTTMADDDSASAVKLRRSQSQSPVKKEEEEGDADHQEEKVGGGITVRLEPGEPPKLARSSSQKVVPRPPPLYLDLPDSTGEAKSTFEVMEACTYANKFMGYTEHAMECDCAEEWGKLF